MQDLLRRELAPISNKAWEELDSQAARTLRHYLIARKVTDFSGPHGWKLGSVNSERLNSTNNKTSEGVCWGVRENLPLLEVRVPFELSQMEIDNIDRGCTNPELDPLLEAAKKAAQFEDAAVFNGFAKGNIQGLLKISSHKPIPLPQNPADYPGAVADAISTLMAAGIGGPYALVLGANSYVSLLKTSKVAYPPHLLIREMLQGGEIIITTILDGGALVSMRGGDFELTVGADYSLGYQSSDGKKIDLFMTESFAFRVLEPAAAIGLKLTK